MTQEEKQLLLKDLCGRLIYELKGLHRGKVQRLLIMDSFGSYQVNGYDAWFNLNSVEFKPYLRPMSSMTEDEKELMKGSVICFNELEGNSTLFDEIGLDWLLAHHFDFRGLIEKGLALEAPEGMYK